MGISIESIQTFNGALWHDPPPPAMADWEAAMWEFVGILESNPQVLAVVAEGDEAQDSSVAVRTYIRSRSRIDRSAIYSVEAKILSRYPATFFDFNVLLRPSGLGEGDLDGIVFYKSDHGDAIRT